MASPTNGSRPESLPSPPAILPNVVPIKAEEPKNFSMSELPKRHPMVRPGIGNDRRRIKLLANHFYVMYNAKDAVFFHYSVAIRSYDMRAMEGKGIGRKVIDKLYQTYSSELVGNFFAYDGEKSLFTIGSIP